MRHQFGGKGGFVAEFTLFNQFVAGIVAVAGQLMVETAFCNQSVEDVVGKAVARTVFIGEAD
ncbi:lipopolysaccharide biosynthesis protein [Neisseria sp. HMSC071A01]|nr:lipopolysaccharide biosynthesis protein [Neisseria sp. HMSC071A01]